MFSYFNSIQGEIKPCKKEDFNRIVQSKRVETAINSISDAAEQWRKGLIDEVGGLDDAMEKLYALIAEERENSRSE